MSSQFDARQSLLHTAVTMIGTGTDNKLDALLNNIDPQMGKLFEDRNIILSDGGNVAFTGTQVNFSANLNLVMLQRQSGAVPTTISLGAASVVLNNGDMFVGVLNRSTNAMTTSIILSGAALPAAALAHQEVFFIMARIDSSDGTKRVVFRDGTTLSAGQTARLGNSGAGGGGGINYFAKDGAPTPLSHNGDFEAGTISPWSLFTTSFSGTGVPTTITAGAANLTAAATPTTPLAGSFSGQLVKGSANAAGQGLISDIITINREDLAKILYGSFSYEVLGGTFVGIGGATSSLELWVYNVNAATWYQVPGYNGILQNVGPAKVAYNFQTDVSPANNQYRIALICRNTTTSPFTVNVDDFVLAPQQVTSGIVITDWVAYTPTFQGFGTVAATHFMSRRVGSNLEIKGNFIPGTVSPSIIGSVTLGYAGLNGPPGGGIDVGVVDNNQSLGTAETTKNSATFFKIAPIYSNATGLGQFAFLVQTSTTASYGGSAAFGNAISDNGPGSVNVTLSVPISGWSSNLQLSADTDTRVVAMRANGSTTTITTGGGTVINPGVAFDTHGAYNPTTGIYTVPVSGIYQIQTFIYQPSGVISSSATLLNNVFTAVVVNSTSVGLTTNLPILSTANYSLASGGSLIAKCNAGDTITINAARGTNVGSFALDGSINNFFSVERLSGPSIIASSESVNMKYQNTAGTTIPSSPTSPGTPTLWPTKVYDSHSAFNAATGIYTVPMSGKYRVSARYVSLATLTNGAAFFINLYFNGAVAEIGHYIIGNGINNLWSEAADFEIACLAGDQIGVIAYTNNGTSSTMATAGGENIITISRIGR